MKKPHLSILLASLGMLAFLTDAGAKQYTVRIPYFNNHVQNYTPLDLSGTNFATSYSNPYSYSPNLIDLDDSNRVAFGCMTSYANYTICTWTNGVLTTNPSLSLNQPDEVGVSDRLLVSKVLPNDIAYGQIQYNEDSEFGLGGFSAVGNSYAPISAPSPYQEAYDYSLMTVDSGGDYALIFNYDLMASFGISDNSGPGEADILNVQGKPLTAFDNDPGISSSDSTIINTSEIFFIDNINLNGWAIGYGEASDDSYYDNYGGQIWDGAAFHALNGTPFDPITDVDDFTNNDAPVNLNNSNQVIVQGYGTNFNSYTHTPNPTEGYIWQENASSNPAITLLRNLIPTTNPPSTNDLAVMAQIQNIEPFAISNIRQTNATDPSNFPILNILATANVRTYAGLTNTQNITNSEIILISQYPDKSWHFKQCLGLSQSSIQSINANGLIACLSDLPGTNATGYPHAFLELPINLINIDDPTVRNGGNGTNNIDITFMTNAGIGTNNFKYRDTNINCVAWIAGNDPTNNNAPRMPWLQAQALGFTNVNTYWKLQVTFHDTNGYPHRDFDTGDPNDSNSSGYLLTNPFTHPGGYTATMPDVVTIPSNTNSSTYVSGWRLVTNGTWNIYQDPDWSNALSNGWFGGDATLSLMISNSSSGTMILPPQNFYFRIAGENPATSLCDAYLKNPTNCGSFWYTYAIVRHETKGEGGGLYYNHFLNNGIKARKQQPGETYEHWLETAYNAGEGFEGKPNWNDDTRYSTSKGKMIYTLGSGGYGLCQLTYREDTIRTNGTIRLGDTNYIMPRSWIWNWQANVSGLTNELSTKVSPANSLSNSIAANFSSFKKFQGDGFFTPIQGIIVGLYNGNGTFGTLVKPNTTGSGILSPWILKRDGNWILSSSYVSEVESCK